MEFTNFSQLDDEDAFVQFVNGHFEEGFQDLAQYADCKPEIDQARLKFAFGEYQQNLANFTVMLESENPDQYKRAGALLHALYQAKPVVEVTFDDAKLNKLEMNQEIGQSWGDVEHKIRGVAFYREYANQILAFDLAFRCCDVYENKQRRYNFDFLDNMAFYLKRNTAISVQSLATVFKALMFDA